MARILITVAFLLLLTHKSDSALVLNRYSVEYAILLALVGTNVSLLWYAGIRGAREHARRLIWGPVLSSCVLVISVGFLLDLLFSVGPPERRRGWVDVALAVGTLAHVQALGVYPRAFLSRLALVASGLVLGIVLLEAVFVFVLQDPWTPQTEQEFLRLMVSGRKEASWPQPVPLAKPPGTFRILGLADSYGTWGGLRSNYYYLLEDKLRKGGWPNVEMVNVSVTAYAPRHELAILRFGMAYAPDIVLHGFYVGNDFTLTDSDMYSYGNIRVMRAQGLSPYRPRHFLIRGWIANVFKLFQEETQRRLELATGVVLKAGAYSKRAFREVELEKVREWGKRTAKDMDRMREILPVLDMMRSVAEKGGARFVMVIHPEPLQVDEDLRREILSTLPAAEREYDFGLPQELLASYCSQRGVDCLDLLPVFRAHPVPTDLYLTLDTHYSDAGNELAARAIGKFLQERRLLPGGRTAQGTPGSWQAQPCQWPVEVRSAMFEGRRVAATPFEGLVDRLRFGHRGGAARDGSSRSEPGAAPFRGSHHGPGSRLGGGDDQFRGKRELGRG